MHLKQAHLLRRSNTHRPRPPCVLQNPAGCKCGRKTPVPECHCLDKRWRCAEVSRSADKVFWQKGKWRMKVNCGGNHDNSNYSCNCCRWTRSVQYNPGRERHAAAEPMVKKYSHALHSGRGRHPCHDRDIQHEGKRKENVVRRAALSGNLYKNTALHLFLSECHHTAAFSNSPRRLGEAITAARRW